MNYIDDFRKYARSNKGISSLKLQRYSSIYNNYISPTIIEERQLNIASMDVFSRLMMDRIIFLGLPIDDYVANIIQAQLLYLDSTDPGKDIQLYFNTPGGSVYAGLGIYDTMQYISADIATICTGMAASMGAILLTAGKKGKRSALKHSRIMIHQPMGELREMHQILRSLQERLSSSKESFTRSSPFIREIHMRKLKRMLTGITG